jgi:hypothetical protein
LDGMLMLPGKWPRLYLSFCIKDSN